MNAKTARKNETCDLERLTENIARWEVEGRRWAKRGDTEMAKMHAKDGRELRALAAAVKAADYDRAGAIACRLDTAVLERIPRRLYNTIARKAQ